jgi:hypothetical protein
VLEEARRAGIQDDATVMAVASPLRAIEPAAFTGAAATRLAA